MASARLNGYLADDGGAPCTVWFEWGLTDQYGKATPFINGINSGEQYFYDLTGLSERTVYHYRTVAQNGYFVSYGADTWFVTPEGEHMMTLISMEIANLLGG